MARGPGALKATGIPRAGLFLGASVLAHALVLGAVTSEPDPAPLVSNQWGVREESIDLLGDTAVQAAAPTTAGIASPSDSLEPAPAPEVPSRDAPSHDAPSGNPLSRNVPASDPSAQSTPTPAPSRVAPPPHSARPRPQPAPKDSASHPPRPSRPSPSQPGTSRTPQTAGAEDPSASSASAATMGTQGLPIGVKHLATAFTRAVPYYNYADPAWDELPLGPVGMMDLVLRLSSDGSLESAEPIGTPSALFQRLRKRTLFGLRQGRFAIGNAVAPGEQILRIEVFLAERPVDSAALPDLGYKAPTASQPGRATMHLESGRYVEVRITPRP